MGMKAGNGVAHDPAKGKAALQENSVCPLPFMGWRPSSLVGPRGEADSPPLVLCIGVACAFFVRMPMPQDENYGRCGVSAAPILISQLPQLAMAAQAAAMAAANPAPEVDPEVEPTQPSPEGSPPV